MLSIQGGRVYAVNSRRVYAANSRREGLCCTFKEGGLLLDDKLHPCLVRTNRGVRNSLSCHLPVR